MYIYMLMYLCMFVPINRGSLSKTALASFCKSVFNEDLGWSAWSGEG